MDIFETWLISTRYSKLIPDILTPFLLVVILLGIFELEISPAV